MKITGQRKIKLKDITEKKKKKERMSETKKKRMKE